MHLIKAILLLPFSLLYGLIVSVRNLCFNIGLLPQKSFDIPIIGVGNLAVGGTGKTPHTEYLIEILKSGNRIAVLSRGYKRKTDGFVLADSASTAEMIGDEPYQLKSKYADVLVAVDENRREGITMLMEQQKPDVILLDDAYQHRYVKQGLSILLTDYNRLFSRDCMLPSGRLREPRCGKKRADVVIVTKCPLSIKEDDFLRIRQELKLTGRQQLFFSMYVYDDIKPVFNESIRKPLHIGELEKSTTLVVTGIVSPTQLHQYLSSYTERIETIAYPDHHAFTAKDVEHIKNTFATIHANEKLIIVTEKDAARLVGMNLPTEIKQSLYSIGIKVQLLQQKEHEFEHIIIDYVRKNKRNS